MGFADLHAVATTVSKADTAEDLFGILAGSVEARLEALAHLYRKLVTVVHPDKYPAAAEADLAREAFIKATALKTHAEAKIRAGTYGDKKVQPPAPHVDSPPVVVKTKDREYTVGKRFAQGDLCDLYESTCRAERVCFKIAQSAADNDLVENESRVLKKLFPAKQKEEKFFRYLPRCLDTFMFRGAGSAETRRVNVLTMLDGYRSLEEVRCVYPDGLDYRDVVWMLKRSLAGLGFVHNQGVIHGAIIPPHVMVHPTEHGAKIIDWSYAIEGSNHVKALSKPWRDCYAPEIFKKQTPTAATDIYMLFKCVVSLLGGDIKAGTMPNTVPKRFQGFVNGCLIAAPSRRPDDAWKLHEELDELLESLVGKPKYRPLTMP